ncbi:PLP-dependent aminotransferase family protein [Paenibacillus alvei]|uniref:PLP-dependent aminotransferase family protein n=1 Tax=Paenibacillus alvei TaxID=44250 RepID=A0ABT4GVP3_PAEAL|nr:PLP-dependent aminotransferase family protein [Paenibacillus alvei]EJW15334.1 2-aminoadipate transaminase LysN [Paenibacillus alvei DSM 29]MCY9544774.1 PLP-dependent aminotransferase family protein [Paenibacillus alvei]MCY9702979.1 PLP-dependent aminotransferase family protein [Paenibacillus alvei]MCY9733294.1 PLP-dependent aminotransferase family protein [Paenibacillus alvei]MCY9754161.1 PLP-dependent aminotransferase family protein [Paenibacillus alvei]
MRSKQIYDYIITNIERGEWGAHDKLPSIRSLAVELNVNRLTVFKAYQLLKQHEKVYVKEKSGYYVCPDCAGTAADAVYHTPNGVSALQVTSQLSDIHRIAVEYQFSQAIIDPNLLPNLFLSDYVKKVFDIYPKLMGNYSTPQGDEELRDLLCQYFKRSNRVELNNGEIVITTGAQQAIDLLSRILIRPLDAVLVERPTYSAAIDILRGQGARLIPVEFTPEGYDLEAIERLMKQHRPRMFYMNPTFHNPTGYILPASQRKQLVELAERYRCVLVEDDAFHDMYFHERPPQPLFMYDTDGWVVYLRSFSKYVAPGLRICAVFARKSMIEPLIAAKSLADNGTPLVTQKIFLHYFQSERMQQHLKKLRTALQIRRDVMEEELSAASIDWQWTTPQGGLNIWLRLPNHISASMLLQESLQHSLSFVPGHICDPNNGYQSWVRLSYSLMNEIQIREGMRQLTQLAQQLATRFDFPSYQRK